MICKFSYIYLLAHYRELHGVPESAKKGREKERECIRIYAFTAAVRKTTHRKEDTGKLFVAASLASSSLPALSLSLSSTLCCLPVHLAVAVFWPGSESEF